MPPAFPCSQAVCDPDPRGAKHSEPVWLLNRFSGCCRRMCDCTDSPWYPTQFVRRQ
jgi:hypothetical protein